MVENKAPADIQITAEQLLREAKERDSDILPPLLKQKLFDPAELAHYQLRRRKQFEDNIQKNRTSITNWLKYAQWEESQEEIQRARSVWERALDVDHKNITVWLKYTEMEMRNRQVNHARNLWDRAVTILPEVNRFWYKYTYMEEMLENIPGVRAVFERWMEWQPDKEAWQTYINFELRYGEIDRARHIYERFVITHPEVKHWIKYARFQENHGLIHSSRQKYEQEILQYPTNYNAWFDYIRLVKGEGDVDVTRETYERAIANSPPSTHKQFWRGYIYLWINYALFEELEAKDHERTRQVYKACLELLPHEVFTFSKIWLLFAHFEIRQKNLTAARKLLEMSLGMCPRNKLFRGYIEIEIQLREFDRCRRLYEKFLEFGPENCVTWMKFAELETLLGEIDRARAIYELAINQPRLDMPELLWKTYVDFEISQKKTENARQLYERLLERTSHVKVWLSFAKFELNSQTESEINVQLARRVFEKANDSLKNSSDKEARVLLLENWREFEKTHGGELNQEKVNGKMPRRIKKRQKVIDEDGIEQGWERVLDYIFPEDEANKPNSKLIAAAKNRKEQAVQEPEEQVEGTEKDAETPEDTSATESRVGSEKEAKLGRKESQSRAVRSFRVLLIVPVTNIFQANTSITSVIMFYSRFGALRGHPELSVGEDENDRWVIEWEFVMVYMLVVYAFTG
ncbi:hypothetical protein JTB14_002118 [Gonioctena quinquepunctata]|nr:hypothetical protein JTB14_002118 [Gonioctena quinquepunctata]